MRGAHAGASIQGSDKVGYLLGARVVPCDICYVQAISTLYECGEQVPRAPNRGKCRFVKR